MPKCAIPYYQNPFPGIKENVPPPPAPKGYYYFPYYWCPAPIKQPSDPSKVKYWPKYILLPKKEKAPKKKQEKILVAIKSPKPGKNHHHPLVNYKMPVLLHNQNPEKKKPKPYKISKSLYDALNKPPDAKTSHRRRRRKKPKRVKKIPKKKKNRLRFLGYHKICVKWILGVIMNRHYKNLIEWRYKDAVFDQNGNYWYCARWERFPIYDSLNNMANQLSTKELEKALKYKVKHLCETQMMSVLNLTEKQRRYWKDKLAKYCKTEALREMLRKTKKLKKK